MYRPDEGALLDDFIHGLQELGVMALLQETHSAGIDRAMVPFVQVLLLYGLNTLFGIERMNALPPLLCSEAALMPLVGFNPPQLRHGVCQRGAAKRQGQRASRPICSDTLAKHIVKLNLRELEVGFNGAIRALAKAGGRQRSRAWRGWHGSGDRPARCRLWSSHPEVRIEDTCGRMHEIEVTVYGWNVLLLSDVATKIPLAVKVGTIEAHETHWTRAVVTQARAHLAGAARLHTVVFDKGFLDGSDLWRLDQHGLRCVVLSNANMPVTTDAQAQAAAGHGITVGHRVHTVRHGHGKVA